MTSFTYNSSSMTHVNAIPFLNKADLNSFTYYSPGSLFMLTPWADRPMPMYLHTRGRDSRCWKTYNCKRGNLRVYQINIAKHTDQAPHCDSPFRKRQG